MKTVFNKEEGVKMNSGLDFGDTNGIVSEFVYLMDTTETMWEAEVRYFYRVTDDDFIQLADQMSGRELRIIAQYKNRHQNLNDNIVFIVKRHIEAHRLYDGYPVLENSSVFTNMEFEDMIKEMKNETHSVIKKAEKLKTSFIAYLKKQNLKPKPTGNTEYSWIASCPQAKGSHFIMVSTLNDEWGCGYCGRAGKQLELEKWLKELNIKDDQKNISKMMKELTKGSIQTKETFKWWVNRY